VTIFAATGAFVTFRRSPQQTGCSYTRAGVLWGLPGSSGTEAILAEVPEKCGFMAGNRKFRSAARFH